VKFFTYNPQLKVISVLVACLLWLSVTTNVRTVELMVPFEVSGIPPNRILVSTYQEKIKVRVTGPAYVVNSVADLYPVFRIDIPPGLQQDRYVAQFSADDLYLPHAVHVLVIEPKQVDLLFDTRIRKEVAVEVPRIGSPDPDYTLSSVSVEPSRVVLEGPSSELRGIDQVETYPLQLRGLTASATQSLGLRLSSQLVDTSTTSVTARIAVQPVLVTETISGVSLKIEGGDGRAVEFKPSTVSVRVQGVRRDIKDLTAADIVARIKVPHEPGKFEVVPSIDEDKRFVVVGVQPARLQGVVVGG
jgi:YbbR domain-containing protein